MMSVSPFELLGVPVLFALDEDARRLQEAFIAVLSHELRTPITTILGGSRLLRKRLQGDPTQAELSADIEAEADRLSRIVDDLLVLSRKKRIAKGCGQSLEQINMFIKNFNDMRKMMHQMANTPMGKMGMPPGGMGMPKGGRR